MTDASTKRLNLHSNIQMSKEKRPKEMHETYETVSKMQVGNKSTDIDGSTKMDMGHTTNHDSKETLEHLPKDKSMESQAANFMKDYNQMSAMLQKSSLEDRSQMFEDIYNQNLNLEDS